MPQPYKKRQLSSWNQGKRYKGDGKERQHAKREVTEQLAAAEADYLERYRKPRRRNRRAHLEYRIAWCEQQLSQPRDPSHNSWFNSYFSHYLRRTLKTAKAQLAKLPTKGAPTCPE